MQKVLLIIQIHLAVAYKKQISQKLTHPILQKVVFQIADCFDGSPARAEILHCCEEVERSDLHQVAADLTKLELR